MRRLTISGHACVEALTVLIAVAWADQRLDDNEKAGVRGAAEVLNLTKELRARLDKVLEEPVPIDRVLVDTLTPRDKAFLYVAAAWMAGADDDVDSKEEAMLDELGTLLKFDGARKAELERIARDLPPAKDGKRKWAEEIASLFKTIPPRLEEQIAGEEVEVVFE